MTSTTKISPAYSLALKNWSVACAAYSVAAISYRARTLGDDAFLAALTEYNKAKLAADVAEAEEVVRQEQVMIAPEPNEETAELF